MRNRAALAACLAMLLMAGPAAAQISDILPPWLLGEQKKPPPRRSYVKLPDPAPLPPARPAREGDAAAMQIPQVPAAAVGVPEAMKEEIGDKPESKPATEPQKAAAQSPEAKTASGPPLPPERPAKEEAKQKADEADGKTDAEHKEEDEESTGPDIAEKGEIDPGFPKVSEESACRLRLEARGVQFKAVDAIVSGKACGIPSAIRVTALSPTDRLTIPALLNCRTAEALTDWYFKVVGPAARRHFDASPAGLRVAASYVCRNRNGSKDGPISEHAFGNAIDISAILFRQRKTIAISRPRRADPDGFFVREINAGACAMFKTVLGPEGDSAHSNHFHLDMKKRARDYRLCQ